MENRQRMDDRPGALKRLIIGSMVMVTLVAGSGLASAGPEDDVRAVLLGADNMFAAGISPVDVFLAWKQRTPLPNSVRYRIEIAADEEGPYTELSEAGCANVAGSCVAVVQPPLPPSDPTPRFYRVVPILAPTLPSQLNGGSIPLLEGPPSLPDPAILGPARPTNLRCNGNFACLQVQSITLTWTDNSDESEFWIMRAKGAVNPQFGTEAHAKVPANVTTYSETILEFNTTYFYKITAVREVVVPRSDGSTTVEQGFSDSLGPDKVKVETPPIPPPADPVGLAASFSPPALVTLTWTDTALDEDGFYIELGSSATEWESQLTALAKPGVGAVTWTQTVPPDTKRCYRVRAYKLGPAYSGYTNTVCLGSIPTAPNGLVATVISNTQVDLKWNDRSDAEDAYEVERCTGVCTNVTGTWTLIGTTAADAVDFSDLNTLSATTYSYRVFASNASGRSAPSNIATVTTKVAPLPKPTTLVATGIGSHRIKLTWTDNAGTETGFRIEFRNADNEFETLAHTGPKAGTGGTVTYIDTDSLPANFTRCYRVRAVKGTADVSDPSNVACGTTLPPLPPNGVPTNLTAPGIFDRRVDLRWKDNATNEDAFRIEVIRFPDQACAAQSISGLPWMPLGTVQPLDTDGAPFDPDQVGTRNWTVTGLQPHTAHFFRVIAVNLDGESAPSTVLGCVQTLGPPLPVFIDPSENGDVEATRCHVDIKADPAKVDKVRLKVLPSVPGGPPYAIETLYLDAPNAPLAGPHIWRFEYKFRKGLAYGLIAANIDHVPAGDPYIGDESRLRDITVLADCPQSGL